MVTMVSVVPMMSVVPRCLWWSRVSGVVYGAYSVYAVSMVSVVVYGVCGVYGL